MGKKYYLDEQGLIRTLQQISNAINQKTSSKINIQDIEDPDTGEVTHNIQNPNNFATVGAVYDYVANQSRKNLTIVKQSAVEDSENDDYSVQNNVSEYNGSDAVQINFNIVDSNDIRKLFI